MPELRTHNNFNIIIKKSQQLIKPLFTLVGPNEKIGRWYIEYLKTVLRVIWIVMLHIGFVERCLYCFSGQKFGIKASSSCC